MHKIIIFLIVLIMASSMAEASGAGASGGAAGAGAGTVAAEKPPRYDRFEGDDPLIPAPNGSADTVHIDADNASLRRYIGPDFVGWMAPSGWKADTGPANRNLYNNAQANCPLIKNPVALLKQLTEDVKKAREAGYGPRARIIIPRCYAKETGDMVSGSNNTMYLNVDDDSLKRYIGPNFVGWLKGFGVDSKPALKNIMMNIGTTCPLVIGTRKGLVSDIDYLAVNPATLHKLNNMVADVRSAGQRQINVRQCYIRSKELADFDSAKQAAKDAADAREAAANAKRAEADRVREAARQAREEAAAKAYDAAIKAKARRMAENIRGLYGAFTGAGAGGASASAGFGGASAAAAIARPPVVNTEEERIAARAPAVVDAELLRLRPLLGRMDNVELSPNLRVLAALDALGLPRSIAANRDQRRTDANAVYRKLTLTYHDDRLPSGSNTVLVGNCRSILAILTQARDKIIGEE